MATIERSPSSDCDDDDEPMLPSEVEALTRRSHPFAHSMTGTTNYGTLPNIVPPDPGDARALEPPVPYPVHSEVLPRQPHLIRPEPPSQNPLPSPPIRHANPVPTLNNSYKRAEREAFAQTHLSHYVQEMLNCPFGKDNLNQTATSDAALRHCLLPLWKGGYLHDCPDDWANLASAYPPARQMLDMLDEYGDVDFNALRGFPVGALEEVLLSDDRKRMATAALLHFDGDLATLVRWIGGPHIGEHRDPETFLRRWRPVLRDHTYESMHRAPAA